MNWIDCYEDAFYLIQESTDGTGYRIRWAEKAYREGGDEPGWKTIAHTNGYYFDALECADDHWRCLQEGRFNAD